MGKTEIILHLFSAKRSFFFFSLLLPSLNNVGIMFASGHRGRRGQGFDANGKKGS